MAVTLRPGLPLVSTRKENANIVKSNLPRPQKRVRQLQPGVECHLHAEP